MVQFPIKAFLANLRKKVTTEANPRMIFIFRRQVQGLSLVVQWLRFRLPTQGTRVQSLVQEDPTCHGATKPVCYNY